MDAADTADIPAPRPAYNERLLDDAASSAVSRPHRDYLSTGAGDRQLFQLTRALCNARTFHESMSLARQERKILLVNLIDEDDFRCHAMTRDVWNSTTVGEVLHATFVFWQRSGASPEAREFVSTYNAQIPFIGGIHPLTGHLVKAFEMRRFSDEASAVCELIDFVGLRPVATYLQQQPQQPPPPASSSSSSSQLRDGSGRPATPLTSTSQFPVAGSLTGLAAAAAAVAAVPRRKATSPPSPPLALSSDSSRGKRSRPASVVDSDVELASEIDFAGESCCSSSAPPSRRKVARQAALSPPPKFPHAVPEGTQPKNDDSESNDAGAQAEDDEHDDDNNDDKCSFVSEASADSKCNLDEARQAAAVTATYSEINKQLAELAAERRKRLGYP